MTDVRGSGVGWSISLRSSEPPDEDARREAFEAMIDEALDQIPSPFRERLDTVAVVAEDEPPPAHVPPNGTLFGLFQGVPRTTWGADNFAVANKITIYRGPHERFHPDPRAQAQAVEATVFHEVAHHFGISDDRLRELQHSSTRR